MRAGAGRAVKSDVLDLDAGLRIFQKNRGSCREWRTAFRNLVYQADFDAEKESQVLLDAISISDEKIEIKEIVEIIK